MVRFSRPTVWSFAGIAAVAIGVMLFLQVAGNRDDAAAPALPSVTAVAAPAPSSTVTKTVVLTATPTAALPPGPSNSGVPSVLSNLKVGLRPYTNSDFGFVCLIPAEWKALGAGSRDGISVWRADERAHVQCYGAHVVNGDVSSEYARARASLKREGFTETYVMKADTSFSVSGTDGIRIVYERQVFVGDVRVMLRWDYPASERRAFDAPVTAAVKGLTLR